MHDPHFFPAVQEQLVEVQGLVVPESHLRLVRSACLVAAAYLGLLAINLVVFPSPGMSNSGAVLATVEWLLLLWLVMALRRWSFAAAVLICSHPIAAIAFYGAGVPGLPLLGGGLGVFQSLATIAVVIMVGQAARAIHRARQCVTS